MPLNPLAADDVLDSVLGGDHSIRFPATVYICLFDADPLGNSFADELSSGGYARVAVVNDDTNWPDSASAQKANGLDVEFPTATADQGTATHWGIARTLAGVTADDMIISAPLADPRTINNGDTAAFAAGVLVVSAT